MREEKMMLTCVDPKDVDGIRNPQWDKAGRVHDWRNHVGENARAMWRTFSDGQRLALAADAEEMAGREEWD